MIGPRSWVGTPCCSKTLTLADRLETQNTELRLTKIDGDTWLEPDRFPKIVADRERFESLISVMFSVFLAHQRVVVVVMVPRTRIECPWALLVALSSLLLAVVVHLTAPS